MATKSKTDTIPGTVTLEVDGDDELGVFRPEEHDAPVPPTTIPELAAFRDSPTRETHMAAAKLLHRTGPLVLDGLLYKLENGRVVSGLPKPARQDVVIPDDPNEVLA